MERYYTAQGAGLGYRRSATAQLRSLSRGWKRVSDPQLSQWDVDISRLTALVARFQPYETGIRNALA